ncbi:MAG: family 78 glycoside hydrolase catalytic domain [Bacteroidales bacterium]|nr:family 78 glycoside hydrolase catalytic domain [Bacteroidales bacterium]
MTEFIREPGNVRIMDLKPEFTWIVPQAAKRQTAFEILVASTKKNLENNIGDVWTSNKVMNSQSGELEYGSSNLSANTTYYWKVRIWDGNDKSSGYSGIQSFTTGDPDGYSTTANRFHSSLVKPERIVKLTDNHYFVDFGRDAFGTLVLEINPSENDTIVLHLGEKFSDTNQIDRNPVGTIRYQKVLLPVEPGKTRYIIDLPPDKRNTGPSAVHLPDSFGVVTPFRYAELENYRFNLKPGNVIQKAFNYYFEDETSSFTSSDTILNQVWDICKYTMKATSFTGIYIDGDRERIPYEADAYINQLGHYYTDREYSMGRVSSEYFMKHPTWPTEWILHTVLMFWNDLMFTGNTESVRAYYEELKHKTLTSIAREDGLISSKNVTDDIMGKIGFSNVKERIRDIVDWPPAQKDTGWKLAGSAGERDGYDMVEINTVVNAFYYQNLVLMSKIAGLLGKTDDSLFYHNESLKVRDTINLKLFDKSRGIYIDGESSLHSSLHANMMPLAFGIVPKEHKKTVINFIKSRGMACSVYGSQYLLEGLYREGEAEYALVLMTATHDRGWWNMIRSGSTIAMEAWDMKYKPNSDWNHAWGAAPANIIPGYMWGIAPAEPGFARAIINPQLGSIKHSKITVPTIRGTITAEFRDTEKIKEYTITIPANMECDFILFGSAVYKMNPGLNKLVFKKVL